MDGAWDSHLAFCEQVYGERVVGLRRTGRAGSVMFLGAFERGEWHAEPSPDLVLNRIRHGRGTAEIQISDTRFQQVFGPGNFVLVPPQATLSARFDGPHEVQVLAIPYAGLLAAAGGSEVSGLPSDGDFGSLHASFVADRRIGELLDHLWRETGPRRSYGVLFADGVLLQIAAVLCHLAQRRPGQGVRGGLSPSALRRVMEFLRAHMAEDVSLADLAYLTELSPHHFCRAFKVSTGWPPQVWFRRMRLEQAQAVVLGTDRPLALVAAEHGFSSQQHFTTAFRRELGISPGALRRDRS